MCREYGMASTLLPSEDEEAVIMERIYNETKDLLLSLEALITKIETDLYERESISKNEVKQYLNEVF
jgi:hypothetical protein